MRLALMVSAALAVALALVPTLDASSSRAVGRTFYLDLRPGQCATYPRHGKYLQVVPCSNGAHNLEAYSIGRGGWGQGRVPGRAMVLGIARSLCVGSFQRRFKHSIGPGYGWYAFWPDPGKEQARYGDRIICSLDRFPGLGAMGPGYHH
jgi:hypothetical protein